MLKLNKETEGEKNEERGRKQPEVGLINKCVRMCPQHQVHFSKEGYKRVPRTQRKEPINKTM